MTLNCEMCVLSLYWQACHKIVKSLFPLHILDQMIIQHRVSPNGVRSQYLENWLVPPPPHCFDSKMPILSFSCSSWAFCPNCPPPVDPISETLQQRFNVLLQLQFYNIFRCFFHYFQKFSLTF